MMRVGALTLTALLLAATVAAAEPKTIYVAIPPLKTDAAKAATEIQRLLKRKPKEVTVVETADAAEYTVEVVSVEKRRVGEQRNAIVPGQTDAIEATVVAVKLCIPAKTFCDTVEGDNSHDALKINAVNSAALEAEGKIRKAIK
jgi:hypothetical protein